ncbi:AAA family ATPase [uncultured Herbaspirillum sp.]|uniref:AAA family ATPase n=1 Tax=uncultured Herbaspirillum sp. TaxID=160236 RepID=UPI00258A3CFB|nr:AAA family ATPase [uncultured Herbaspirillum sp.]
MNVRTISIQNCNSIENAVVTLCEGVLNIKFGPNGLGKSTIARAIAASVMNNGTLQNLKPFKYRTEDGQHNPSVTGTEGIRSVLVFDENYVSQFTFQRDEVLKNSFDIFIKTDTFKKAMSEIEELLIGIKSSFENNAALESAISDLKQVQDGFGVTRSGALSKSSKGYKAFGSGNKIENIPFRLEPFAPYIKSEKPASWISWQSKGTEFLDIADNCPYCSTGLQASEKDLVRQVSKEYDSKSVEHLSTLQSTIDRLGSYFEQSCKDTLEKITKSKLELSLEETNFLCSLSGDVETLIQKLEALKAISFFALREVDKLEDEIDKLKIDLTLLPKLNSPETNAVVDPINSKLQELVGKLGVLKGRINRHKNQIEKSILDNQKIINDFLRSAGYKYSVVIKAETDSYKMKLVHKDFNEHLESATQHLSYGERNAFSLVLFMHQVLREKPDLAVLDDPVSSFDKTKKFAILSELFRGKDSLRNTTVLMLTHDIEPAIDVIRGVKNLFQQPKPTAYCLQSRAGFVKETEIKAADIQTFSQICSDNVAAISDEVIKCIYLRRNFEILNDLGSEYNYLANLLHGRPIPIIKNGSNEIAMSAEDINSAETSIKRYIPDFEYQAVLSVIKNKMEMKRRFQAAAVGYDKLQLFRIYKELHVSANDTDDVLQKFVNESFHIENEYLMQLNPHKFDNVPEHIIEECERIVSST